MDGTKKENSQFLDSDSHRLLCQKDNQFHGYFARIKTVLRLSRDTGTYSTILQSRFYHVSSNCQPGKFGGG